MSGKSKNDQIQPMSPSAVSAILQEGAAHDTDECHGPSSPTGSNPDFERLAFMMAHDLKAPLRSVGGYAELLAANHAGQLDDQGRDYLKHIRNGVKSAQHLIDGIMAFGTIAALKVPCCATDLNQSVRVAMERLQGLIEQSEATVRVDPLPKITAHPEHMAIVFQNLIENAIKYRSEKPPLIEIGCHGEERTWIISVRDNGIGIKPEDRERIFEIFTRVSNNPEVAGNGIGLAIVRKILESHGGSIHVNPQTHSGCCFSISVLKSSCEARHVG